jgi:hypothetical protein
MAAFVIKLHVLFRHNYLNINDSEMHLFNIFSRISIKFKAVGQSN